MLVYLPFVGIAQQIQNLSKIGKIIVKAPQELTDK